MRIDPQVAALRSDKALQRRLRLMMEDARCEWLKQPFISKIDAELAEYDAGLPLASLHGLSQLLRDHGTAARLVAQWCALFASRMKVEPLAQIPFRHGHSKGLSTIQLIGGSGASLSLLTYEELDSSPSPKSALFADRDQLELVISGTGKAQIHQHCRAKHTAIQSVELTLSPGVRVDSSGPMLTRTISAVEGAMVLLQLTRTPHNPSPSCELRLDDAELLRQASGDKAASACEMGIAVLGAMERSDAAPAIAALIAEGPDHLRWEALRQTLGLNPHIGFAALTRMTRNRADPLNAPAKALHAQLLKSHPRLARETAMACL